MKSEITMALIAIAFVVAAIAGWVMNILMLINDDTATTGMIVARAAGILVAPLGAILGWI